jgi:hypothetical protein
LDTEKQARVPYEIAQDIDGLPLFPKLDFEKENCDVIKTVMEGYPVHLWGKFSFLSYFGFASINQPFSRILPPF